MRAIDLITGDPGNVIAVGKIALMFAPHSPCALEPLQIIEPIVDRPHVWEYFMLTAAHLSISAPMAAVDGAFTVILSVTPVISCPENSLYPQQNIADVPERMPQAPFNPTSIVSYVAPPATNAGSWAPTVIPRPVWPTLAYPQQ